MSRTGRLFQLMDAMRGSRRPVTAAALAEKLGVSERTIYRDMQTLAELGAPVEGSAGLGYLLRSGFFLPPLMFGADEVDAVILGLRFVSQRGDDELARAAGNVLAKIAAVLPPELEDSAATSGLLAGPGGSGKASHLAAIRRAIRSEEKLQLDYSDKRGEASKRVVWPVAVGFFEAAEVLAAWCETRRDFRHFRLDRIAGLAPLHERTPKRHRILLAEWRLSQDLDGML